MHIASLGFLLRPLFWTVAFGREAMSGKFGFGDCSWTGRHRHDHGGVYKAVPGTRTCHAIMLAVGPTVLNPCLHIFWYLSVPFSKTSQRAFSTSQDWPPTPGKYFDTSILNWSMNPGSFWRGDAMAMSEVMGILRTGSWNWDFLSSWRGFPEFLWIS